MPVVKCRCTQDRLLSSLTTVWGWKSLSCRLCLCESVWLISLLLPEQSKEQPEWPKQAHRCKSWVSPRAHRMGPIFQTLLFRKKDYLLNWLMTRWFSKGHWILKTFQTAPAPQLQISTSPLILSRKWSRKVMEGHSWVNGMMGIKPAALFSHLTFMSQAHRDISLNRPGKRGDQGSENSAN